MRQNNRITSDTPAWYFQTWAAFLIALLLTSVGIYHLPVGWWARGFLVLGMYFSVSAAFGLAKTIRDRHEADKLAARVDEARTERVLREMVDDH
ncbi:MAG: hypothetical protein H6707_00920 [Deltaproteobacteria bacterium]|nr:hypothetical protein [Deltaproteobacteria bacterium]